MRSMLRSGGYSDYAPSKFKGFVAALERNDLRPPTYWRIVTLLPSARAGIDFQGPAISNNKNRATLFQQSHVLEVTHGTGNRLSRYAYVLTNFSVCKWALDPSAIACMLHTGAPVNQ